MIDFFLTCIVNTEFGDDVNMEWQYFENATKIWIFALGSGFVIFFIMLNQKFMQTNYYQNQHKQVKKFINGVPYELEIVNTGSSYGRYGFDYSETALKGFNLGIQPQSLSYDFKILKQYKKHFKTKCKVIIVLPTLVFGFIDYPDDLMNTKYYYFLDTKYINGYSKFKYFTRIKYPILAAKRNLKHFIKDQEMDLYETNESNLTYQDVEKEAKMRIDGWKKQFNLENMSSPNSVKHLENIFINTTKLVSKMIDFCISNGFCPVIVVPPVSKVLNNMISREFMEEVLYKNIRNANTQNIQVCDYLYDERFQNYKLYVNSDFLNKKGRSLLTKTVIEDLK